MKIDLKRIYIKKSVLKLITYISKDFKTASRLWCSSSSYVK